MLCTSLRRKVCIAGHDYIASYDTHPYKYDIMTCYVCFPAQSAVRDIAIDRDLGLRFLILLNLILYGCLNRLEFLSSYFHPSLLQNLSL